MKALEPAGCLYLAKVMHRRRVPPLYRFVYRVFYLLVDVDRLDELAAGLRGFSHNRFNLCAIHDADHGDGQGLRPWAERVLREHGVSQMCARIRLLAMPRLLGMAFNPLSLWYCERADGSLLAIVVEVRNTFGEKHSYVLASNAAASPYEWEQDKDKCFHVSPFFDLVGRYRFTLPLPGERLRVAIAESREGAPLLDATLAGQRVALTAGSLWRQVLRLPWQALKVVGAIHWEALRIWLRGARFHRKPAPPVAHTS